jgi:molecular chaperone DnaK (HSP70)
VTPISFGVELVSGAMSIIIPRGTVIPTKMTERYTTVADYQESIIFKVFEGEDKIAKKNKYLGEFTLKGIQRALKGKPDIETTIEIDNSNMLSASAIDKVTNSKISVKIKRDIDEINVD